MNKFRRKALETFARMALDAGASVTAGNAEADAALRAVSRKPSGELYVDGKLIGRVTSLSFITDKNPATK